MSSIFGKFDPYGIKKLPAPERSGGLSNVVPDFFVFGTEKNLSHIQILLLPEDITFMK